MGRQTGAAVQHQWGILLDQLKGNIASCQHHMLSEAMQQMALQFKFCLMQSEMAAYMQKFRSRQPPPRNLRTGTVCLKGCLGTEGKKENAYEKP